LFMIWPQLGAGGGCSDDEIGRNLLFLAHKRPDVFGSAEEEIQQIVKNSLAERDISGSQRKPAWDGVTTSGAALQNLKVLLSIFFLPGKGIWSPSFCQEEGVGLAKESKIDASWSFSERSGAKSSCPYFLVHTRSLLEQRVKLMPCDPFQKELKKRSGPYSSVHRRSLLEEGVKLMPAELFQKGLKREKKQPCFLHYSRYAFLKRE
jgi:hypothetical protein